MAAYRNTTMPRTRAATPYAGESTMPAEPRRRRPAARALVVPRLAPGDREHGERDGEGGDRAGDRQLGRDGQVLGPADPVGQRDPVGHARRSADLELDDDLLQLVGLDLDHAGLVDGDLRARGAGVVRDLLLGRGVHVQLARLVGLDLEHGGRLARLDARPARRWARPCRPEKVMLDRLAVGGGAVWSRSWAGRRPRRRRTRQRRPARTGPEEAAHDDATVTSPPSRGRAPTGCSPRHPRRATASAGIPAGQASHRRKGIR